MSLMFVLFNLMDPFLKKKYINFLNNLADPKLLNGGLDFISNEEGGVDRRPHITNE